MARGERHNADYFPFFCKEGNTTKYIDTTYGNDGFAVWVKLLRQLTTENYHYIDLSSRKNLMVLCSTCKVSEELLLKIIGDLVEFQEFDAELWVKDRVIWSDKFIESIEDAYKNRKNKILKRAEFIALYEDLTGKKLTCAGITYVRNPQSKEDKSKEEETRVIALPEAVDELDEKTLKKSSFLLDQVCEFFHIKTIVTSKIYDRAADFCATLANRGQIDAGTVAFEKYKAYKARSQEQIHGPEKWMGTKDNYYQDGIWNETDWEQKLKQYDATRTKQNTQTGTTAASAVIEPGKGLGDLASYRKNRANGK